MTIVSLSEKLRFWIQVLYDHGTLDKNADLAKIQNEYDILNQTEMLLYDPV